MLLQANWLAGYMVGSLTGWQADWPVSWLAGWPADGLPGQLAGWLASWLAAPKQTGWLSPSIVACPQSKVSLGPEKAQGPRGEAQGGRRVAGVRQPHSADPGVTRGSAKVFYVRSVDEPVAPAPRAWHGRGTDSTGGELPA